MLTFQVGVWQIGQSNLFSFSIPQELEKSVQMLVYTVYNFLISNLVLAPGAKWAQS